MLDRDGYRPNVGIVLINQYNQVFWGKRKGEYSWQFPQGGIAENETPEQAMFRELDEELGLEHNHVKIVGCTEEWLYYDVPGSWSRQNSSYRGQKQIWYLLRLTGGEHKVNLRKFPHQEFDAWRWINYWDPIEFVIKFKQQVYTVALNQLSKLIHK